MVLVCFSGRYSFRFASGISQRIMKLVKNLLILEDDFEAVSELLLALRKLEEELLPTKLVVTVYTDYKSVEERINDLSKEAFDVILLDRDCILGGSFHCLDIEKFGVEKIISISSTPQWNIEAQERGITRVIEKRFDDLRSFAERVANEVRDILIKI
jgi:hypothetical protein